MLNWILNTPLFEFSLTVEGLALIDGEGTNLNFRLSI